jgi:RHS repeat-associated protein
MLTATSDPNGHITSVSYQCSNSLPYQVQNPVFLTAYGFDCASGAPTSVRDPNDLAAGRSGTTYAYEATMGRLYTVSTPDGGVTAYSYPSISEVDTTVIAAPDPSIVSKTTVDAYGRSSTSVMGGVETDSSYDVNGRVNCTTNPYTTSPSGSACISAYDGLDRPLTQTLQDGATRSWSYAANTTTSTDERGASWTKTNDAFGKLSNVIEPGPSGSLETDYFYDGLGNVATIVQNGNAANGDTARIRSFMYDSLSRLVTATSPEAGTICYGNVQSGRPTFNIAVTPRTTNCIEGYDSNGNPLYKTDARGKIISYTYDQLNRLTLKQYNDGTPPAVFGYDGNDQNGNSLAQDGFYSSNGIGRLSFLDNATNTGLIFSYDAMGRITAETQGLPSVSWGPVAFAGYDLAGHMNCLTYPDGRHVQQTFDSAGRLNNSSLVNLCGTSATQNYVSSIAYNPDGSPNVLTLGNGVQQTMGENNRQQVQNLAVSGTQGTLSGQGFLAHSYSYGGCSAGGMGNNGVICGIADTKNSANTQAFTYDSLNRIVGFSVGPTGSPTLAQQFQIDSFSNMTSLVNGSPVSTFDPTTNRIANLPCASSVTSFDASGNQLCSTDQFGGISQYSYDAESRLSQINALNSASPFVSYIYGADGERVRKSNADGAFTEYADFGGQIIAEKDQNGNWTDYVYANGRKIAVVPSVDHRIHLSGTTVASGFEWGVGIYTPGAPVVQSGDQVCWQQYNASAVGGINLQMSSSGGIAWLAAAEDGQEINQDTVAGGWQNRCFSMTPYVGQTIQIVEFLKDVETPAGNWSLLFADLSYVAADGTVTQLVPPSWSCAAQTSNPGTDTSLACVTEDAQIATDPIVTANSRPTHFLLGDQLATAQMEFSSGGWPLWQGRFAPYGQELDNQTTANNYKYTGLERDSESDLDHADFRQLAYLQGRWMSTDPDDGSIDANNPQSLNRYAYVGNNPLSFSDPSGLNPEGVGGGAGAGIGCTAALGPEAGPACFVLSLFIHGIIDSFFDHPRLQGTTTPRPGARIWDEHGSYQAKPYSSAADILGLDNSGCESGACGSSFGAGQSGGCGDNRDNCGGNDGSGLPSAGEFAWDLIKIPAIAAGKTAYTLWYYTAPASCFYVRGYNSLPARVGLYGSAGLGVGSVVTKGATATTLGWAGAALGVYSIYAYELNGYCSKKE